MRLVPCRQWWPRASVPTARDPSQPPRRGRCTSSRSPERKIKTASAKKELLAMFCCSGARLCFPVWRLWNQVCLEEESCKTQSQVLFKVRFCKMHNPLFQKKRDSIFLLFQIIMIHPIRCSKLRSPRGKESKAWSRTEQKEELWTTEGCQKCSSDQ